MADGLRKRKRKKTRYTTIKLKLTTRQKRSLLNYCEARRTTPNKLIKKHIRRYLYGFEKSVPDDFYATEKQLDLFE